MALSCVGQVVMTLAQAQQAPLRHESASPGPRVHPPPFQILRYDEDYSYLRDPAARTGDLLALEPIKYLPLDAAGHDWLSLGGEIRLKYEYFDNPLFGLAPSDGNGSLLQRYLLHGDLHLGRSFRVFAQLRGAYGTSREGPPIPVDEDGFDVQQAFFDLRGERGDRRDQLILRVGRQEMTYGVERLISVREATNVRRAFDAVRLLSELGAWHVDGFLSRPVVNQPHELDEWAAPGTDFWGIYATGPTGLPGTDVDLYYLGLDRDDAVFEQGTAHELRHTIGARLFGEIGPLDFDVEAMYQWGAFGAGDIRAWAIGLDGGYTFRTTQLQPRLALRISAISGDRDPQDDDLETFNPLFPRGNYFGESAIVGPINLYAVHPLLTLQVSQAATLETGWAFFWRYSTDDGFYGNALNLIQASAGNDRRGIGSELSIVLDWKLDRYLGLRTGYSHFFAGPFLEETGPGKDVDFFAAYLTYQF